MPLARSLRFLVVAAVFLDVAICRRLVKNTKGRVAATSGQDTKLLVPTSEPLPMEYTLAPGVESLSRDNATVAAKGEADCEKLQDFEVTNQSYIGMGLGKGLVLVCKFWPESWGSFPVTTVEKVGQLADVAFRKGGIVDQIKDLVGSRVKSDSFCWRHNVKREELALTEKLAFVMEDIGDTRARGNWSFTVNDMHSGRKRYRKMGDSKWIIEWSNSRKAWRIFYDNTYTGHRRKSLYESKEDTDSVPEEGWMVCPDCIGSQPLPKLNLMESTEEDKTSEDNEIVSCSQKLGGTCYDECPTGFDQSPILGRFLPVCTVDCSFTSKPVQCGLGCASTSQSCTKTIASQVGEVVKTIGRAVGFVTGRMDVVLTIDALASVVTFCIGIVAEMVEKIVKTGFFDLFEGTESKAELLMALLRLVVGEDFRGDLSSLLQKYGEFVSLMRDVIEIFTSWQWSTPQKIAETFLSHGAMAIAQVYNLIKAFVWPQCEVGLGAQAIGTPAAFDF